MHDLQIRKLNKYQAEKAFMTDNAADFPKNSPGDKTVQSFAETLSLIETLAGQQMSQVLRQNVGIRETALERLVKLLQKMNRAGAALAGEIDGLEKRFRLPRRHSKEIWLAVARAFYADSTPFEVEFQDFDLAPTFRADLLVLIAAVETAAHEIDIAGEQRGGATGGLVAAFREAGRLSRRLNAIIRNKYVDDPRKLAAWAIASHLEAAPVRQKRSKEVKA